jgi:hypothetical protein
MLTRGVGLEIPLATELLPACADPPDSQPANINPPAITIASAPRPRTTMRRGRARCGFIRAQPSNVSWVPVQI